MKRITAYLIRCCLLASLVTSVPALSGELPFRPYVTATHFASDDEMLQGNITGLKQDFRGLIWVSSFNGLNKYDGYRWEKYKSRPSSNSILQSNRIDYFWENSLGDFYCIADGRLYMFDVGNRRFIDIQHLIETTFHQRPVIGQIFSLPGHYSFLVGNGGECYRINDRLPEEEITLVDLQLGSSRDFYSAFQDRLGREWILTGNGTWRRDLNGLFSNQPFRFYFETEHDLWLTSADGKTLARHNASNGETLYIDFISQNGYIYEQHSAGDSLLYVASGDGLYRVDTRYYPQTRLPGIEKVSDLVLQHFYIARDGSLWGLSADMKVWRLTVGADGSYQEQQTVRPDDHHFEDPRVQFHEDSSGLCWMFCFDNNDILYFDSLSDSWQRPIFSSELSIQRTQGFFIDLQGNIWYRGRRHIDVLQIHNEPFLVMKEEKGREVRAVLEDSRGRLWLGLREQEVVCLDSGFVAIGRMSIEGTAYHFCEDSRHNLWIASKEGGLYCLPDGDIACQDRLIHYHHDSNDPTTLLSNNLYYVMEDSQGHLWTASFGGGINLFKDSIFYHKNNRLAYNSELPETVRCLCEVRPGVMLVGARNGLFVFDNRFDSPENIRMLHYTKRPDDLNSLPDNDIMSILVCSDSSIILTTNSGGICRILNDHRHLLDEPIRFASLNKDDGLASDVTYASVEDPAHNLWISSGQTLSKLQHRFFIESDQARRSVISIYDIHSFPEVISFSEAHPILSGDRLIFGTLDGLFMVESSRMPTASYLPPLIIEQLSDSALENSNKRSASLRFAALDYRDKRHLKYAYRLEGVDRHWNITSDNTVTYARLPVGHHLFHVRSTNADGIWTDNEKTLDLYVKPLFHETWLGRGLILTGILLLILVVVHFINRAYRLRHALDMEQENTNTKLRFFTDISHELRTPLTLIDGPVSEVLEDGSLSDQSRYYLEVVQKNVRRLLNLVNQILDFRKLQNHKMTMLVEEIDIRTFMEHIMENFSQMAGNHHIDFRLEAEDVLPSLWADRDKLEKIFFNLLSNAFKYTPDGKAITLRIYPGTKDRRDITVEVADQGQGIRREDLDKLFQRYETIVQNNLFKPSSGIGLSLVKQFAELHHAQIKVSSELGVGSTFAVVFKTGKSHFERDENVQFYLKDMDNADKDSAPADAKEALTEEEGHDTKVLIVEDNDELRDFMARILGGDYRILTATDGEEGLSIGKKEWPDLIITDIMMPKMDGFEMITHLKQDPDLYAVPIIALTAKGELDDKIHGVRIGVDDYVLKPFSSAYLKARVASLLEKRRHLQQHFMELLSQGGNALARRSIEPNMPDITPADELFIQDVMAFMEKNMDNAELTIDQFADAVKMGRTVFYNKLKSTLGLTPIDFVQEMRIKRAIQLMKSSGFTIAEIAYQTGFNDPKYFSRSFKKHMNTTPSEYMKSLHADQEEGA